MLSVYLICVGKLKEKFYQEACAEYIKRLSPYCRLTLVELPEEKLPQDPSQAQIDAALEKESQAIRTKLPPSTSLVCLCVEGRLRSSEELSALVGTWEHSSAKHLAFVIGGSYGLAERLKGESWVKLSMSPMTFPHHLARVMLLEQIYRAFKIREGSSYHKKSPSQSNRRRSHLFEALSPDPILKIELFRWKFPPDCGTLTTRVISSGFFIHRRFCRYVLPGKL